MGRASLILAAFLLIISTPVLAGTKMNRCVDTEGRVTFTTQGCAEDESKRRIYVPDAQASISSLRPVERQQLGSVQLKSVAQHQSSSSNRPSWGERQALKNAQTGQPQKPKLRVKRCNKK